eukprot:4824463-Pyramimonas_sp.AAC.1
MRGGAPQIKLFGPTPDRALLPSAVLRQIYAFMISVYRASDDFVDTISGGRRWGKMYADHRGGPKRSSGGSTVGWKQIAGY